jgi:NhaC family Na+:H+ antiporter
MSAHEDASPAPHIPSLVDAVLPLLLLAVLIAGALLLFGLDALDGPIQVALVVCCLVAALIVMRNRHSWDEVQHASQEAMGSLASAVFILLAVGAIIGVWNLSGTIPTLVYYGIQIPSPSWYYAAAAVICGVVSLSIGSSWTTAGTIGVGLVGIAVMLGVFSGAYLGDKTSPLSETTILTAQMVKVDLYDHIRAQVWTSIHAFGLAFVALLVLGFVGPDVVPHTETTVELAPLDQIYWITPWALLPLVLLVALSIRKVPAALALMSSTLFAGLLAPLPQWDVVKGFVEPRAAQW